MKTKAAKDDPENPRNVYSKLSKTNRCTTYSKVRIKYI